MFFGDIRSFPLSVYHDTQRAFATVTSTTKASDVLLAIDRLANMQSELLLSPQFFFDLQSRYPEIKHIEIHPKMMLTRNELSRYRYTAILFVERTPMLREPPTWFSWSDLGLTMEEFPRYLRTCSEDILGLWNIPMEDMIGLQSVVNVLRQRASNQDDLGCLQANLQRCCHQLLRLYMLSAKVPRRRGGLCHWIILVKTWVLIIFVLSSCEAT